MTFEYDASGRRTKVIDALLRETQFVYDAAGRLTETIYPDSTPSTSDNPRTLVSYDGAGRKVSETDPMGRITRFAYDKAGRLIAVFLPNPTTGANPALNLSGSQPVSPDSGVLVTRYAYDQVGNKVSQTDALGRITRWRYDDAGRVLKRTLPLGQYETFVYDTRGRQQSHTDFRGRTTGYSYHANTDQLATIDYPNDTDTSFTYTADGQIATVVDVNGTTTYTYTPRNRLSSVSWPNGLSLSYGYDAAGNRTSLTTAAQSVAYTYDVLNRLSTVTPSLGGGGSYTYDAVGNRATLTHANGVVTSYGYNPRNQLTTVTTTRPGNVVEQKFTYTLDNSGLRLNVNETYGTGLTAAQAIYTYDPLKRLKTEYQTNSGGSRNVSWVYDGVGNRLSEARTGSVVKTTTYTYDANDRLTSEVVTGTGAGTTTYTYDTAGNLTQKDAPGGIEQYAYDDANRLREYTDTALQVTRYAYNHDGIRLSQTQNATGSSPSTTHYLVDPNTTYAQVVEEHTQAGSGTKTLSALYVLGDDRISQYRPAVGSTAASTRHYHADGLGSTRLLTNTSAAVTDRYAYHAFGELDLPGSTVTSPNDFLFTGEQRDPNSGFYYLRARYMDPKAGRFTAMDSFLGKDVDPSSLHKYTYAHGSPTNYVDPTGHYTADFGRAVEDEVCDQYKAAFVTGAATECGDVAFYSFDRYFKPDVMDWGAFTFNEVKPLSPSGIAKGITQIALYAQAYGKWNFTPNVMWIPEATVVDDREVFFMNLSGVIFYTDDRQLKQELAAATLATASVLLKRRAALVATRLGADAAAQALITRAVSMVPALNAARLQVTTMLTPFLR